MGEDRPAWFYVDGQLRYRDEDGWTDQYQTIDSASEANVLVAEPDEVAPSTRAEARRRGSRRSAGRGRPRARGTRDVVPEVTQRGGAEHRTKANRPRAHALRRICAVVLIAGAIGVWFGMSPASPETSSGYHQAITAALAADATNNKTVHGAAGQTVVNGWTARDLLAIIAKEGTAPRSVDERPAALLALLVIGLGVGIATTRLTVREPT
ncbi:MAG: hypothetical protein ABI899_04580 [Actinomycetota bacterium]